MNLLLIILISAVIVLTYAIATTYLKKYFVKKACANCKKCDKLCSKKIKEAIDNYKNDLKIKS